VSTIVYAALTNARASAPPDPAGNSTRVSTYVDALAALVPSEVLMAHGAILTFTTSTSRDGDDKPSVAIEDALALKIAFFALCGLSMVFYAFERLRARKWENLDWIRLLIPPASFVFWTMLQKATAFDAFKLPPWLTDGMRGVIAILSALVLGVVATALAYRVKPDRG